MSRSFKRTTTNAKIKKIRFDIAVFTKNLNPVQLCVDDNQVFQIFIYRIVEKSN